MPVIITRWRPRDSRICRPAKPKMRMPAGRNRLVSVAAHLIMRLAAVFCSSERSDLVLVGTYDEVAGSANLSLDSTRLVGGRRREDRLFAGPGQRRAGVRRSILPRLSRYRHEDGWTVFGSS